MIQAQCPKCRKLSESVHYGACPWCNWKPKRQRACDLIIGAVAILLTAAGLWAVLQ